MDPADMEDVEEVEEEETGEGVNSKGWSWCSCDVESTFSFQKGNFLSSPSFRLVLNADICIYACL